MNNLIGDRIYLREFKSSDWPDVHEYASHEIVCRFQPWGPNTEEQSVAFVNQIIEDTNKTTRTRFVFAIVEKSTDKLIGAGEFNVRCSAHQNGEIGFIVHPDYWGNGYATEAAKLLVNFGFKEFHLHRIYATCDPRNIGSSKVLAKIGMTQEGRLRDVLLLRDGWRDSLVFSILEDEWKFISSK